MAEHRRNMLRRRRCCRWCDGLRELLTVRRFLGFIFVVIFAGLIGIAVILIVEIGANNGSFK